jgi:hypothetical protein
MYLKVTIALSLIHALHHSIQHTLNFLNLLRLHHSLSNNGFQSHEFVWPFFFRYFWFFGSIILNMAKFNPIISILLLSTTVQCQFDLTNKILLFLTRDFMQEFIQRCILPCLLMTGRRWQIKCCCNPSNKYSLVVHLGYIKEHKYLAWISGKLIVCIKKKNYIYRRCKKYKADCVYDKFSLYRKLFKIIKLTDFFDPVQWMKIWNLTLTKFGIFSKI